MEHIEMVKILVNGKNLKVDLYEENGLVTGG